MLLPVVAFFVFLLESYVDSCYTSQAREVRKFFLKRQTFTYYLSLSKKCLTLRFVRDILIELLLQQQRFGRSLKTEQSFENVQGS
jgi:hypothetical protein